MLGKSQNIFDQVLLQSDVIAGDIGANLLQHQFPVLDTDHRGKAALLQSVPDNVRVVGQSGGDLNTGTTEDTVDGINQRISSVMQRRSIRLLNHTHAGAATEPTTDSGDQHGRIGEACPPGLIPGIQSSITLSNGGPQSIPDASQEFLAAALGDEIAVQ